MKHDLDRLCELGVLTKTNDSKWASLNFIIPKKYGTVRFVSDFRKLNSVLKQKPYLIPKTQDVLQKLGGFTYATSLDLNMRYYTICLRLGSSWLCTFITPWGKYQYNWLSMGIAGAPDVFQEKMSELMGGLKFFRTYLDDLLTITKGTFDDNLEKVEQVLKRLQVAGLRCNKKKYSFATQEIEYLGYLLVPMGIRSLAKKVESIQQLAWPATVRQLRHLISMINYCCDMWKQCSHVLARLTKILSKQSKKKIIWGIKQEKAFNRTKELISADAMLMFPQFGKPFEVHTNASNYQFGSVISQNGKPIAFYSWKFTSTQQRYTLGKRM